MFSIALFGPLSIVAVVAGHVARRQIAESGGRQTGGGLATAAIVIGWLGVAASFLALAAILGLLHLMSESGSLTG